MTQFQPGKTYQTRSICDSDTIFEMTVLRRTAKTIRVIAEGEEKTLRPYEYDGSECVRPFGSYSMAPTFKADREIG